MTNEQKLRALVDAATPGKRDVSYDPKENPQPEVWLKRALAKPGTSALSDYLATFSETKIADARVCATCDDATLRALLACVEALRFAHHEFWLAEARADAEIPEGHNDPERDDLIERMAAALRAFDALEIEEVKRAE